MPVRPELTSTSRSLESVRFTVTPSFSDAATMAFSSHLIVSYSSANEGVGYSPQSSSSNSAGRMV